MKFMKLTAAGLAALMLAGCGKNGSSSSGEEYEEVTVSSATQEAATETELQRRTLTLDLSGSGDKRVLSASLTGNLGKKVRLYASGSVLHKDLVGAFGQAVSVQGYLSGGAVIEFEFDPDNMRSVPPENLILLYYNEATADLYDEIPVELDSDRNTIKAVISGEGDYLLADGYEWYSVWGADLSRFTPHESILRNDEFGFELTLPLEIEPHIAPDYYHDPDDPVSVTPIYYGSDDGGAVEMSVDHIEYPGCVSAESYISEIADAVVQYLDQEVTLGSLVCDDGQTAWYYIYEGDPQYGMHLGVQCAYPITDTQYIKVYICYDDEEWQEKAMEALKTFRFYE